MPLTSAGTRGNRLGLCTFALIAALLASFGDPATATPPPAGTISTVVGNPTAVSAATALAQEPASVAVSPVDGSVYVADLSTNLVRSFDAAGQETAVAGDGNAGYSGDGGPATAAKLWRPDALVVDGSGDLLIGDAYNERVRLVAAANCSSGCPYGLASMTKGYIYTIAGDGTVGSSGDGGPASAAELYEPDGLAVDVAGDLLISDSGNERVQLVAAASCSSGCPYGLTSMTEGDIYTIAGNETAGFSGNGGPATTAELDDPTALTVDGAGDLLIADRTNARLRLVAAASCSSGCPYGLASMTKGYIYTIAGDGTAGFSGNGSPATAAELDGPGGVALDAAGDVLISDSYNQRVRLVAAADCASNCPYGLASMTKGDIYTIAGNGTAGSSGDGGPATAAELADPGPIAVGSTGELLIADGEADRVRVVASESCSSGCPYGLGATTTADIYTVAGTGATGFSGDGGPAAAAELDDPSAVDVDADGDVLLGDAFNDRVRMVAGDDCASDCPYGLASMTEGDIYTVAGNGSAAFTGAGEDGPATDAEVFRPDGLAVDDDGDLIISEEKNRVRLVAGASCTSDCPYGLLDLTAGDIYTVAGDGTAGFSGNGGPATDAEVHEPSGLAVDGAGDLLIGETYNQRVRLVAATNCASACPFGLPSMTKGFIYTVAGDGTAGSSGVGGHATEAELDYPNGVAVDGYGDLLISNTDGQTVSLVANESCSSGCPYGLQTTTRGDIYTVAGSGSAGSAGDNGPATGADLYYPRGIAVDGAGDLLISDTFNNRVQIVAATTCATECGFGLSSTAKGDIYTVAGDGQEGFSGDGGPATAAGLDLRGGTGVLTGLAVEADGNLLIADTYDSRIRQVASGRTGARPTFTAASPPSSVPAGSSFEYTFSATGTPTPTYSLAPGAPSWLTIDPTTGRVSGVVPAGTADFSYSVTARNSFGERTAGPFHTVDATSVGVSGTVLYTGAAGESEPASGVLVDACVTSGGPCYSALSNASGDFTVNALPGTSIILTAYAPTGHALDAYGTSGPLAVPAGGLDDEAITIDAIQPIQVLLTESPGPATLNWGSPSRATVTGCADGLATVTITGENAQTDGFESNVELLPEEPAGSGSYSGILNPQAPIHGPAQIHSAVTCAPESAMLPSLGPATGGTTVFLTGSGLTGATAVDFGGVPASSYRVMSEDGIEAVAPAGTGTVPVTVDGPELAGGSATIGEYTYVAITGVSPSSGSSAGGTVVTVTGTGLGSATTVRFGQQAVTFNSVSSTELRALSPPGEGTQDITVETAYGGTTPATGAARFTYTEGAGGQKRARPNTRAPRPDMRAPRPVSLRPEASTPAHAALAPARIVPQLSLTQEAIAATVLKYVYREAPSLYSKLGDFKDLATAQATKDHSACGDNAGREGVKAALGLLLSPAIDAAASAFTAQIQTPLLLALLPEIGPGAAVVVYAVTPLAVQYLANEIASRIISAAVDATLDSICKEKTQKEREKEKEAKEREEELGGGGSGTEREGRFSPNAYIDPSGTVVDANGVPIAGATATILRAEAWDGPFTVVSAQSPGILPAENPETTDADGTFHWEVDAGYYEVSATAPGCSDPGEPHVSAATIGPYPVPPPQVGLTVTLSCANEAPAPAPAVEQISEHTGPTAGGTAVTVTGTNFTPESSVLFGSSPSQAVTYVGPQTLRAVSPPGGGSVDVVVKDAAGASATSPADRFFYGAPPTVSALSAREGPAMGGTTITVSGTGFTDATAVDFGGVPGTALAVKSDSELEVTTPERRGGTVDVEVLTPAGANEPATADEYRYLPFAPVCAPVAASATEGQPTTVRLSCNGEELIYDQPQAPAHGTLANLNPTVGTVVYTPASGYTGPDAFTYTAHNEGGTSAPASVSVSVVAGAGGVLGSIESGGGGSVLTAGMQAPLSGASATGAQASPAISDASMTSTRFRVAREATAVSAGKPPLGSTFRFTLSAAASVRIALERVLPGLRRGASCLAPSARLRRAHSRSCTRTLADGHLARSSEPQGADRVPFSGRVGTRALSAGSYRAVLTAANASGHSSPVTLSFAIVG